MRPKNFSTLLAPAVYIMSRLRYTQKFLLISVLFSIPIFIGLYSFIHEINVGIEKTRAEERGLHTIDSVRRLLQDVQHHRGMMNAQFLGEAEFEKPLIEKRQQIEQDFVNIEKANQEYSAEDGLGTSRFQETSTDLYKIKNKWGQLEEKINNGTLMSAEESYELHTALSQSIITAITYIGDASGLILDPYLDTYYLVDVITRGLPRISEDLGQARALGLMLPQDKELLKSDKQIFFTITTVTNSNLESLNREMGTVFKENAAVREKLSGELSGATLHAGVFLNYIDKKIINAGVNKIEGDEYYQVATGAIDHVFVFYDSASLELHRLFEERIKEYEAKRNNILLLVGIVVLLVGYFFLGFYLGLRKLIDALKLMTEDMLSSGKGSNVSLDAKDELGEVAVLFNKIAQALARRNVELKETLTKQQHAEVEQEKRAKELERLNRLMINREFKMMELKKEIADLREKIK